MLMHGFLVGCAGNKELIKFMSTSTTQNVFQEMEENIPLANGDAILRISSSLKTHNPGIYIAKDVHGTPDFKLLFNIDGQAVLLLGDLQKEDSKSRGLTDQEAGDGIRYQFNKNLRLKAGNYKIFMAIPDNGIALKKEITIAEGDVNNLVIMPIYNDKTSPVKNSGDRRPGVRNFKEGIGGLKLTFNSRSI